MSRFMLSTTACAILLCLGDHVLAQARKEITRKPLPVTTEGTCFVVKKAEYVTELPAGASASLTVKTLNKSGDWVAVEVHRGKGILKSGHLNDRKEWAETEALQIYLNSDNKINRWAPGLFGIPGNGGGEVRFNVPVGAKAVFIELDVVKP